MIYNKHRFQTSGRRFYGSGFFTDAIKSAGKKLFGIVGSQATKAIENKSKEMVESKLKNILSKKIHQSKIVNDQSKTFDDILLKRQRQYGTGFKRY